MIGIVSWSPRVGEMANSEDVSEDDEWMTKSSNAKNTSW